MQDSIAAVELKDEIGGASPDFGGNLGAVRSTFRPVLLFLKSLARSGLESSWVQRACRTLGCSAIGQDRPTFTPFSCHGNRSVRRGHVLNGLSMRGRKGDSHSLGHSVHSTSLKS